MLLEISRRQFNLRASFSTMIAEELMPSDPAKLESSVLQALGISAFRRGRIEVALNLVSQACADPEAPAAWYRDYAEMLDRDGQSEAAEAAARLATQLDPDCASAWETLGTILVQRGSLKESCDCYERAIQIDPTFAHAINNLAVTLDRLGKAQAAEQRYREVLGLMPNNADVQLNLATLLGELGQHMEALQIAKRVCDRNPRMMRAHALVTHFANILRTPKPCRMNGGLKGAVLRTSRRVKSDSPDLRPMSNPIKVH
jgi:Flp pilus assembly protein TadD